MPTYEYQCAACGKKFELFQSITAKPIKKCPHCGKNSACRLISAGGGIIFKGSGFYETDYRSEGYKTAAKKESPSSDAPKAAGDTKDTAAKETAASESPTKAPASPSTAPSTESKPASPSKKGGKNKP